MFKQSSAGKECGFLQRGMSTICSISASEQSLHYYCYDSIHCSAAYFPRVRHKFRGVLQGRCASKCYAESAALRNLGQIVSGVGHRAAVQRVGPGESPGLTQQHRRQADIAACRTQTESSCSPSSCSDHAEIVVQIPHLLAFQSGFRSSQ